MLAVNREDTSTVYELYRPVFVSSSNSSMVDTMQAQLVKICPSTELKLLSMQADFDLSRGGTVRGTWMNTKTTVFGSIKVNGYSLLIGIFVISFVAQLNVIWEYHKSVASQKYEFFERPCSARWLEYAFTSPCMVTVISSCLLIRDVYTTMLLAAAQGALVQFGFSMECAFELRVLDKPDEPEKAGDAVGFKPLPILPLPFPRINPRISQQLWYWSFVPSTFLHVLIWGVLISNFYEQTNTVCSDTAPEMPDAIAIILFLQAGLFTTFMVVAVRQALNLGVVPFRKFGVVEEDDVKDSFVKAFYMYTILSAVAKAVLGATYLSYVWAFPFYTPA
jgi:hypothetical protein